ncbi:MAG: zf-HC2 domain-containing protein [Acidobacteriaceae bacterium]|nr:zf-HC2 domain-containing protein [Acidobacteriaceae bacterium]
MRCPTEEILRRRIDGELSGFDSRSVDEHVGSCESCRSRSAALAGVAAEVQAKLAALTPQGTVETDLATAFGRFWAKHSDPVRNTGGGLTPLFAKWSRPAWGTAAAVCAIAFLFSLAPARTWGQKILQMLRVQKVTVVPVDISAVTSDGRTPNPTGRLLTQVLSDSVVVTMKPGPPQSAPTIEAASQVAGFPVRALSDLGPPQKISVQDEAGFHMTLDRERMQDVVDQVGRTDIQIPNSVNGSTVAVHIPKGVRIDYGDCEPRGGAHGGETRIQPNGTGDACISLFQVRSPVVSVPPALNIPALAEAVLQVTGMSAADAHALCRTIDWSSTLVVPVPQNTSSVETVAVDGVEGTLVEMSYRGKPGAQYTLFWVKAGIVYSINGAGNPERALGAAASLN